MRWALSIEPSAKSQIFKYATKTPKHQITQKSDNQAKILLVNFCALVFLWQIKALQSGFKVETQRTQNIQMGGAFP